MAKDKQSPEKKTAAKAAKKSPAKNTVAQKAPVPAPAGAVVKPSHEQLFKEISVRAYEIYCSRGAKHGAHQDDWLRAESEIRAKYKI